MIHNQHMHFQTRLKFHDVTNVIDLLRGASISSDMIIRLLLIKLCRVHGGNMIFVIF
jgi:hypothetical protein